MTTRTRIEQNIRALTQNLSDAVGRDHYATTRDTCPHCETDTLWVARPLNGFYRCQRCGNDPLDVTEHVPAQ
jgi:ribosomal protein L37AE/L43A